ncbi:TetR/AcrR family transcriptional regulator [Streptomyces griseorubiginosus]|uniref:TetR/AcrR family transcriptional regulator n=1 Tax=Streptomyces griseorubiginosus TaxID=67304 RepID=UPI001140375A|nr:TetR/AcrR family transcriptional regulator [Streptomyces griseorubiginosus]
MGGSDRDGAGRGPRARRSKLTRARQAELFTSVLDLLREVGYDGLTMEAVAARTRCSKATLYRQWTGKPQLVAEALRHEKPVALAGIDTGSLRGDFLAVVGRLSKRRMEQDTALLRGLVQAAHAHPDLLEALRALFVSPELTGLAEMLGHAVERGEVSPDVRALPFVPHTLVGLLLAHQLAEAQPADPAFVRDYLDAVVLPALDV